MSDAENVRNFPGIRKIPVSKVRYDIGEIVNMAQYGKQRATFTRYGKPVAAIVTIEDLELLMDSHPDSGREEGMDSPNIPDKHEPDDTDVSE